MVESIATSFNLTTGFPRSVYHPVLGRREVNSFEDVQKLPPPLRNWFNSAADADAARTQPEADAVVALHNRMHAEEMARLAAADPEERGAVVPDLPDDHPTRHVVRQSVQAQEEANRLAADAVASGSVGPDTPKEAVMAGPVAPPLVPAQPGAVENVEPPEGGPAAATSPEEVAQLTREAAASDIIPSPGQEVNLAEGDIDQRTVPAQTRSPVVEDTTARTGGAEPPPDQPKEAEPPEPR